MRYVEFFAEATPNPALLGGKGSNIIRLVAIGANVPPGFIITTNSYTKFLEESKNRNSLKKLLSEIPSQKDVLSLSQRITRLILDSGFPEDVKGEIRIGFDRITGESSNIDSLAVRSSATIEDTDMFSFAGRGSTYLNNNSFEETLLSVRNCWASLFSPQALNYFLQIEKMGKKCSLSDIRMGVIIQKMIDPKVSGVLFTVNVINNNKDQMMINSTWGLGETIANNLVIPDMIILQKNKFEILRTVKGKKEKTSIINPSGSHTIIIDTDPKLRAKYSLSGSQLRELHKLGLELENRLKSPQDIEWAMEGNTIYVLQSRPITTLKSGK